MDLNPQPPAQWTSAEGPYELADHCVENKTNLLVLLNAWLDSGAQDDGDLISEDRDKENEGDEDKEEMAGPDRQTLNFWTARLWPLWRRDARLKGNNRTNVSQSSELDGGQENGVRREKEGRRSHETIVVACNRTGEENGMLSQ
jgi:protein N-terminal amidase